MPEVTIVDTRRILSVDAKRMGKWDRLVAYSLGPGENHVVRIPDEELTEAAIRAAITADVKERATWAGKKLSV